MPEEFFQKAYILKELLFLVEKATFSKEFRYEFECGGEGQVTGLNVLAKIDEIDMSISLIQASKSQKRDLRHFSRAKVCYSNGHVKFENFRHMEWSEEKFWKGIVGDRTRLRF